MHGAPVSPREPPMMKTLPEVNFVDAADAPRHVAQHARRRSARPRAAPARRAGCRCRSTSTSPAYSLPGRTHSPTLGRWNVAVATQCTAGPATSPVDASTPDGMSHGDHRRPRGLHLLDHLVRGRARRAGATRCRAARRRSRAPCSAARPRTGSAPRPGSFFSCACASSPIHSGGHTACTSTSRPGLAQQPRGDDPVAAVVALAADDRDPPRGRAPRHDAGEPLAGALHQLLDRRPSSR